jgi:regulator of sirC expression with transglutaminase-like and TPR domain
MDGPALKRRPRRPFSEHDTGGAHGPARFFWTILSPVVSQDLLRSFARVALSPDPDLAVAALMIARVAYPKLDADPYLERLDVLGREAAARVADARVKGDDVPRRVDPEAFARITALNEYLFNDLHFVGNDVQYEDPRNSFLNDVLDRRTGIPITLALVYMEVARRAGVEVEGINFPGHFLLRCRARPDTPYSRDLIIDAHHRGALLTDAMCRELLHKHTDEGMWDQLLLDHATKPQILARMLLNLKRVYVGMYSFPQARDITELLLAVDPSALGELKDRGLLAYHLNDFSAALRDLQTYLSLSAKSDLDERDRDDHAQIWEHVKSLRRRVASLN